MKRVAVVVVLVGTVLTGLSAVAAQVAFAVTGRLSATDQEADEGYFAIDQQTMIVVKPGSEEHAYLRNLAGKRVRLIVEPIAESE